MVLCGDGVVPASFPHYLWWMHHRQTRTRGERAACYALLLAIAVMVAMTVCGQGRTCASDCDVRVQTLNSAKKHSCFHWECEDWQRANREAVDAASRHTWTARRDIAMSAMTTGKYGKNEEWNAQIKHTAPIMKVRVVQTWDSFECCLYSAHRHGVVCPSTLMKGAV